MNKLSFYGVLVAVIGICLVVIFKNLEKHTKQVPETQQTNNSQITGKVNTSESMSTSLMPPSVTGTTPTTSQATNESIQQALTSLSNAAQNWSTQVHGQIQFYGKIVDDSNYPIQAASVEFVWTHFFPLREESLSTNTSSDQNGLFSISGVVGNRLGVHIGKTGYYYVRSLNSDEFDYSSLPGNTPFAADSNNPVIFHLRKKGSGADLISGFLKVKIPLDGTPVNVDFLNRNFGTSGPFQVSQVKPSYETWKQAKEWSFKMIIPGGGLIEQHDEFPFEAPETGYQTAISLVFKAEQPDWKAGFKQDYYIVFGSPPLYGRLTVETDVSWGGALIDYAVNPDGSRNLEPK
jgi:hypothetical protein